VIQDIDGPVVRLELQVSRQLLGCAFVCYYSILILISNTFNHKIKPHNKKGACGTCPSSTQTMKMGLERGLKEKIPEIQEVIQAMPEGPPLNEEQINVVLDGVRPFLQVAGGSIDCNKIEGIEGLQPTIFLEMKGNSASLNSVKLEIAQRLLKHFMMAGLRVEWIGGNQQTTNGKRW
jgi:Fe-S cluster biogenesis protein NfuA